MCSRFTRLRPARLCAMYVPPYRACGRIQPSARRRRQRRQRNEAMANRALLEDVRRRAGIAACVLVLGLTAITQASAQGPAAQKEVDKRPQAAATSNEPDSQRKPVEDPPEEPFGFRWDDHPSLHLGKGTYIDFRARFQADFLRSDAHVDAADDSETDFARRRVALEGQIGGVVDFQ